MNEKSALTSQGIVRWIRLTWGGWILGIPCIAALALVGEMFEIGGAQFLVGAGMGAGVGLTQALTIRKLIGKGIPWVLTSMIGLALPFVVTDLAGVLGRGLPYVLEVNIAIGGLIVGLGQSLLLRHHFARVWTWIVTSTIGWSLAGATSAIADHLLRSHSIRGISGALAYLGIVVGGGLILGIITSISWHLMTNRERWHPAV